MAHQAGLYAVITFRTGPGRSEFWAFWGEDTTSDPGGGWFSPSYYNNRVWADQAAQDAWVEMWRYTAQRYKDNPIVVGYDLMCEPNSNEVGSFPIGDPLDIWDPEEFYAEYGGTLYDWNQLYPRIVTAIRQVDPHIPILVGGMGYSAVEWLPYMQPTDDPRGEPRPGIHSRTSVANDYDPSFYDPSFAQDAKTVPSCQRQLAPGGAERE